MDQGPSTASIDGWMDHFFRHEAGRIVSLLTKIFGIKNLALAEDMVQETLIAALQQWSFDKVPENPSAWVLTVAKRKLLNFIKREKIPDLHALDILPELLNDAELENNFQESQVKDSMLRMIFVCCHPLLPIESQIAITLKILCGFNAQEIANALFTQEATIQKRLYRAKEEFRQKNLPLEIPEGEALESRLQSAYMCIYLLFNEGYNSSHPDFLIRKDLCAEAMRLCMLLIEHFPEQMEAKALMALMCFHVARFESRIDDKGALIIFSQQNRSQWNQKLILQGLVFLTSSAQGNLLSEYHVEASIAAEHCTAKDFASTNWSRIDSLYEVLGEMKNNPVIKLNRAIILSQMESPQKAICQLLDLREDDRLKNYYLLYATLGELYLQNGERTEARKYFSQAQQMTASKTEMNFLEMKIKETL